MKRLLGIAAGVGLAVAGIGAGVGAPAHAQNGSQCESVAPPGMPNGGVLAVAAGAPDASGVAVRCTMTVAVGRALYWGARTTNAFDIIGTRTVNGAAVKRVIASGKSALDNGGLPAGGTFQAFSNETLTVTIYGMCSSGQCVAEGMAGIGG